MAVVDGPMGLVKEARTVQEVTEARALEAVFSPLDLCRRTAPGLSFEYRPVAFREFAVEPCVMGDDDHGIVDERRDRFLVDPLSGYHLVGDVGETSSGIGTDGSLNEVKVSLTPATRPSDR
ncbi:hypothetical protein ACFFWD_14805 [Bradyrhizobium erythrophlei]|uniref:hypothetical protein n=1 Tax=Bradyrhizobium erythrophlei TaxID=1437360 RepID=UPI0035E63470